MLKKIFLMCFLLLIMIPFQNCTPSFQSKKSTLASSEQVLSVEHCDQIPNGGEQTVRMYRQESGLQCDGIDRKRVCTNGIFGEWTGSDEYSFLACTVNGDNTASCGNTPHGDEEVSTFFENLVVAFGSSCGAGVVQRRLCQNGVFGNWDGSLVHQTCSVASDSTLGNITDVRMFIFGHSLILHAFPDSNVPFWLNQFALAEGLSYAADGQYGFLFQHEEFNNVRPQWNIENVPDVWTNENTPFSQVDFNLILSTPANFVQYQPPNEPYYQRPQSPVSSTVRLFDNSREAHPGIPFYIYENWPDMGTYGDFPGGVDITRYHNDTLGSFHDWFLEYQDSVISARPNGSIKMIPVGPTISYLLLNTVLSEIPLTSLYEDDAPHGEPTIYFLASLVTYMSIYKRPAPAYFIVPMSIHPLVRENYSMVINTIWSRLQSFNDSQGNSRVF